MFCQVWFPISTHRVVGTGSDPEFVVWSLQWIWHRLAIDGVGALWSTIWEAPVFHPTHGAFALSDGYLIPGLLTYPLARLTGSAPLVLSVLAQVSVVATAIATWAWMRQLGYVRFAPWAGLILAAGGWVQDQSVHPQNQYVFVFPLLMLMLERAKVRPSAPRLLLAGLALGWIGGWNLYFQIFGNVLAMGAILVHALRSPVRGKWRRSSGAMAAKIAAAAALAGALQTLWVLPYLQIQRTLGSFRVPSGVYADFSARLSSFWAHSSVPSLLQALLPFYPEPKMGLESVGFLGFASLGLIIWAAWKVRASRVWVGAALFVFWCALGPRAGMFSIVKAVVPGVEGARALGRVQILVAMLVLPAIALALEALKSVQWRRWALGLVLLELIPSGRSPRVELPPEIRRQSEGTEWTRVLAQLDRGDAIWVLPSVTSRFQASVAPVYPPVYGGYSGRMPISYDLLQAQINARGITQEVIEEGLEYLDAPWVASWDVAMTEVLMRVAGLRLEGCFAHGSQRVCLFRNTQRPSPEEREDSELRVDRDGDWEYQLEEGAATARFHARRPGSLQAESLAGCHLEETLRGPLGIRWTNSRALVGTDFMGIQFGRGEVILEKVAKQWIYRLPPAIRFTKTYQLICQTESDTTS